MSHTTEQPVLEPSNPQGLRIGDICSYSFGEKNRSYSIVEIVRILDSPYEVAEVKFLDVVVDDSGNGYFTYLLKTKKTMNASLKIPEKGMQRRWGKVKTAEQQRHRAH
mgnify:CR=1 FL=1